MADAHLAAIQVSLHLPGSKPACSNCTVLSYRRAIPATLVLDNTTENYNLLTLELGEILWELRHAARRTG